MLLLLFFCGGAEERWPLSPEELEARDETSESLRTRSWQKLCVYMNHVTDPWLESVGCLLGWLVACLGGCLLGSLVAWFLGSLVAWLLGFLVAWLVCWVAWLLGWYESRLNEVHIYAHSLRSRTRSLVMLHLGCGCHFSGKHQDCLLFWAHPLVRCLCVLLFGSRF